MNSVFVGTVEGSRAALEAICTADQKPRLVVTLPPELARRHSDYADLVPLATRHGVPIHLTANINAPETLARIAATEPDIVLVIGWSQIAAEEFRALPRLGCLGFHPANLPRLRGRAVIPWAILLGERQMGSSLFWIDAGIDSGDIASQTLFSVDSNLVTARELYDRHLKSLAEMLPDLLKRIATGDLPRVPQNEAAASFCSRRRPEDGRIDWSASAATIHRLIRAVGPPYPGAFTEDENGNRLTLVAVRHTPREHYFIGLPGQVQATDAHSFTVCCGDGRCIDILDWTGADAPPRLHTMLGKALP